MWKNYLWRGGWRAGHLVVYELSFFRFYSLGVLLVAAPPGWHDSDIISFYFIFMLRVYFVLFFSIYLDLRDAFYSNTIYFNFMCILLQFSVI